MIGIVLASGEGTRCYPLTSAISKHLLPIYDKPMLYYPVSFLMEAGIRDIVIITDPKNFKHYTALLGDGTEFGVKFHFIVQAQPLGTANAFKIAAISMPSDGYLIIYGDNYIRSSYALTHIKHALCSQGATVFACRVDNPQSYGVLEFSKDHRVISLEEKPSIPKSNYALIGLMYLDNTALEKVDHITLSERNEYEITDVLKMYMGMNELNAVVLDGEAEWSDLGTPQRIAEISQKIMEYEQLYGEKIGCLEEIALKNGWILPSQLVEKATSFSNSQYGRYLLRLIMNLKEESINE